MTRIIIAGSRDYNDYIKMKDDWVAYTQREGLVSNQITIISGGAKGADTLAERLAKEEGTRL